MRDLHRALLADVSSANLEIHVLSVKRKKDVKEATEREMTHRSRKMSDPMGPSSPVGSSLATEKPTPSSLSISEKPGWLLRFEEAHDVETKQTQPGVSKSMVETETAGISKSIVETQTTGKYLDAVDSERKENDLVLERMVSSPQRIGERDEARVLLEAKACLNRTHEAWRKVEASLELVNDSMGMCAPRDKPSSSSRAVKQRLPAASPRTKMCVGECIRDEILKAEDSSIMRNVKEYRKLKREAQGIVATLELKDGLHSVDEWHSSLTAVEEGEDVVESEEVEVHDHENNSVSRLRIAIDSLKQLTRQLGGNINELQCFNGERAREGRLDRENHKWGKLLWLCLKKVAQTLRKKEVESSLEVRRQLVSEVKRLKEELLISQGALAQLGGGGDQLIDRLEADMNKNRRISVLKEMSERMKWKMGGMKGRVIDTMKRGLAASKHHTQVKSLELEHAKRVRDLGMMTFGRALVNIQRASVFECVSRWRCHKTLSMRRDADVSAKLLSEMKNGMQRAALQHLTLVLCEMMRGVNAKCLHAMRMGLNDNRNRQLERRLKEECEILIINTATRELRAIMCRLSKGERAMRIEVWRTNKRVEEMHASKDMLAHVQAEMSLGRKVFVLRQMALILSEIMRGVKGKVFQAFKMGLREDNLRRKMVTMVDNCVTLLRGKATREMREILYRVVKGKLAMYIDFWRAKKVLSILVQSNDKSEMASASITRELENSAGLVGVLRTEIFRLESQLEDQEEEYREQCRLLNEYKKLLQEAGDHQGLDGELLLLQDKLDGKCRQADHLTLERDDLLETVENLTSERDILEEELRQKRHQIKQLESRPPSIEKTSFKPRSEFKSGLDRTASVGDWKMAQVRAMTKSMDTVASKYPAFKTLLGD